MPSGDFIDLSALNSTLAKTYADNSTVRNTMNSKFGANFSPYAKKAKAKGNTSEDLSHLFENTKIKLEVNQASKRDLKKTPNQTQNVSQSSYLKDKTPPKNCKSAFEQ